MSKTIKIRRGNNSSLPAGGTVEGEPRFSLDTKQLYIDDGTNNIEFYNADKVDTISGSLQTNINTKSNITHNHNLNDLTEKSYNSLTDKPSIPSIDGLVTDEELTTISGNIVSQIPSITGLATEIYVDTVSGTLQEQINNIDVDVSWGDITSKPTEFTPAEHGNEVHSSSFATETQLTTVSGVLQSAIDNVDALPDQSGNSGKFLTTDGTDASWATVSGGGGGTSDHSALDNLSYASSGHTGFQPAGDYITDAEMTTISGNIVSQIPSISGLATETYVDTASGTLQSNIDSKEDAFSKNTAFNKNFGSGSDTVCEGDDSRLSDSRTPTSHGNEAHSSTFITSAGVTYENLNSNSDVGTGATQVAAGNHNHDSDYADISHDHDDDYEPKNVNIQSHITDTDNPHSVDKTDVGLGNVPNTDCTDADNISDGSTNAIITLTQESNFETAYSHSQAAHAPTNADNTAANETSHADVVVEGDIGLTVAAESHNHDSDYADISHDHDSDYAPIAEGVTNGDSHDHSGGDGAQIAYSSLGSIPSTFAPASHNNTAHSETYITSAGVTYENLNGNSDVGTGASQVAAGNHTHSDLHTREHTMTGTSDHSAGNHKLFYSDGSGDVQELSHGTTDYVLTSNGASSAPSWQEASGGDPITGATDNTLVRADGTTGLQDSGITISDTDDVVLPATSSLKCPEKLVIPLNEPTSLENGCIWIA